MFFLIRDTNKHVLDSYPELAILVIARLVGDNHIRFDNNLIIFTYANRALMNPSKVSDPMPGSMKEVQPFCPQMAPSQYI